MLLEDLFPIHGLVTHVSGRWHRAQLFPLVHSLAYRNVLASVLGKVDRSERRTGEEVFIDQNFTSLCREGRQEGECRDKNPKRKGPISRFSLVAASSRKRVALWQLQLGSLIQAQAAVGSGVEAIGSNYAGFGDNN